ncbi:MAG: DNA-3-methyladenine glycosylase I [Pseudomonadota bacterium]|nr:DNA-3-methyladenine glycosylase I [Pseudomonadota bacterium]
MTRSPSQDCCPWSVGISKIYSDYHDREWGVPLRTDSGQFEFLILESAQAGLSWATVLHKRLGYKKAFADFNAMKVSKFTNATVERLCCNPAIIRNRLKINAAISNARAFLEVQSEFGTFCDYIWGFVDNSPIKNSFIDQSDVPSTSKISDALSKDMKNRGFKFIGSKIMYAHMQATGMVNDHLVTCFRYNECSQT